MIKGVSGLVIRTAFNNQGWAGRCVKPLNDPACFKCIEGGLFINRGNPISEDGDGYCIGKADDFPLSDEVQEGIWCWEQVLCVKYLWGNVKGKWSSVYKGMPVYFVFTESNLRLTLWGHSTIRNFNNDSSLPYPYVEFEPFKPLSKDKWIRGLTGEQITGKAWRQLNYRYLGEKQQIYLDSLVKGKVKNIVSQPNVPNNSITVEFKENIIEQLQKIAETEGRDVKELVREAVAKLIRERR